MIGLVAELEYSFSLLGLTQTINWLTTYISR